MQTHQAAMGVVLDMARAHLEDLESGIQEGIYLAADNPDVDTKRAALELLEEITERAGTIEPLNAGLWHMQLPVLSTAHITFATNGLFEGKGDSQEWLTVARYLHGFFISIPEFDQSDLWSEHPPADLLAIWQWARERSYGWVRLDADGDVVDGLPVFDWEPATSSKGEGQAFEPAA